MTWPDLSGRTEAEEASPILAPRWGWLRLQTPGEFPLCSKYSCLGVRSPQFSEYSIWYLDKLGASNI